MPVESKTRFQISHLSDHGYIHWEVLVLADVSSNSSWNIYLYNTVTSVVLPGPHCEQPTGLYHHLAHLPAQRDSHAVQRLQQGGQAIVASSRTGDIFRQFVLKMAPTIEDLFEFLKKDKE